jgi:hypothetical protein
VYNGAGSRLCLLDQATSRIVGTLHFVYLIASLLRFSGPRTGEGAEAPFRHDPLFVSLCFLAFLFYLPTLFQ